MNRIPPLFAALGLLVLLAPPIAAYEVSPDLTVFGYFQTWLTVFEQMEDAQGQVQQPSGDEATDNTAGFRINRVRVGLHWDFLDRLMRVAFQLKLEEPIQVLDLYLAVRPWSCLEIRAGQFKIPSSWEALEEDSRLDFLLRSDLSTALADYALSRTTYASSLFYGNRSQLRDLGLGLKFEAEPLGRPVRLFAMVGNGLGANLFIGGVSAKEFILTNGAQFFYGARLTVEPWPGVISLGAHASWNRHDDVLFKSGRVVMDLHRVTGSADLAVRWEAPGLRLHLLYGAGAILEDWDDNGKDDYVFDGWEARLLWRLDRLLAWALGGEPLGRHGLELGVRFEQYNARADEVGPFSHQETWTFGLGYSFREYIRVQLNVILRRTAKIYFPDLDDNGVLLGLQAAL
ncbi:MAG: hypothetical protein GYA21_13495 [Myxococcales bacterium]|nr:hypothetical protein [Myxococcales bacterium]